MQKFNASSKADKNQLSLTHNIKNKKLEVTNKLKQRR